ncbi:MAG: folylpolyglutamate synthase/dihydrofolate synthase family protein [Elusimicrobiota bacterium]|nr:folylpolyglutamate synthase/dihydrofolate synthase family protein [Elusimicrobiota bacterium]
MTYEGALAVLAARQETVIDLGLGRVKRALARLGDPQEKVPAFHVAGTNGKGSTCAILASVLRAAGYRVGLYVSPHLLEVRERVSVDGTPISKADFARLFPSGDLTYFELLTVLAFRYFAEKKCDVMVLETGLGGRLDATNAVKAPLAAVVTSVDFDHQAYLGRTLKAIAGEKAGIFKPGRPAVHPRHAVLERLAVRGRRVVVKKPWPVTRVDWKKGVQTVGGYRLSLLGSRQGWNAALAHAAVEASGLRVPEAAWRKGLARVSWPGRFEVRRRGGRAVIIDGAHNPEAARALAATFKASPFARRPARWVLGMMRDKDARGVLAPLAPFLKEVFVVRPPSPRAMDPVDLAQAVRRASRAKVTISDLRSALRARKTVVCAGSLYLAGAVLRELK